MTNEAPIQELAELATLDAYGLLEAADQFRFEQAFLAAPPDVQAEIRRIQSDIALDESLLPDGQPSLAMRQRVLDRIQAAMAMQALSDCQPTPAADTPPGPLARIEPPKSVLGSVWTWRMAALVLLGVCLTLVVTNMSANQNIKQLVAASERLQLGLELEDRAGDAFDSMIALMSSDTAKQMYLASPSGEGLVRISLDEQTGQMVCLAFGLTDHPGPCLIEIEDASGATIATAQLQSNQYVQAVAMTLDPAKLRGARFKLIDGQQQIIAATRVA